MENERRMEAETCITPAKKIRLSQLCLLPQPSIKLPLLLFPLCILGAKYLFPNFIIFGINRGTCHAKKMASGKIYISFRFIDS
jgi:hypothetical protein